MAEERFILTRAGYEQLQRELDDLVNRVSVEMAEQLRDVHDDTEFGEETTYHDVMAAKERLDERIAHLRRVLQLAQVLGDDDPDPTQIDPGERVTVWDFAEQQEVVFDLLGSEEVAHGGHGVSLNSPVGRALLGKRVGDVVEVDVPDGKARYAIRKIERVKPH